MDARISTMAYIHCTDCDPLRRDARHFEERFAIASDRAFSFLNPVTRLAGRLFKGLGEKSEGALFYCMVALKMFREKEITSDLEPHIFNRTLVFVREARKRNIPIQVYMCGGICTKFFSMIVNGKKLIFDELPTLPLDADDGALSNKFEFKEALLKHNFPTPKGKVCTSWGQAQGAARTLGYPLVVKPSFGSQSKHTTCNITTEEELLRAVKSVTMITREFLVEQYIPGKHYRITVLNNEVVGACFREPCNVIGDGSHTIEELAAIKNQDPQRGDPSCKHTTLHHITFTPVNLAALLKKGMSLQTILPAGEKTYLQRKTILSGGSDIHDCTDDIHPDIQKLFQDVTHALGAELIGYDFMCSDITRSWRDQECAILEGNSKPSIDVHHYSVSGKTHNVAGKLLDYILTKHV